jgi:hypothetical protein
MSSDFSRRDVIAHAHEEGSNTVSIIMLRSLFYFCFKVLILILVLYLTIGTFPS